MLYPIALLLLLASWLQPMHILPWTSWHSEMLSFAAMFFLAIGVLIQQVREDQSVQLPQVSWVFFAFLFILGIQLSLGLIGFYGDALVLAAYLALCIVGLAVGQHLRQTHKSSNRSKANIDSVLFRFAVACLLVTSISAWECIAQSLDIWTTEMWFERTPDMRRPGASLGQANQLATLLVMGLTCLAYLHETGRISSLGSAALYIPLAIALAATASRSGLLSFMTLVVWWNFGAGNCMRRATWLASAYVAILLGVFVLCWPSIVVAVQEGIWSLDISQNHINVSGQSRLRVWEQLYSAVRQHPWFGWGLREVATAHNAVADQYAQSAPFTYAHSIVLELAIGVGLPLALTIVGLTGWWLTKRIRGANDRLTWFCLAFLLPFGIHSLFEFPFAYAYFLLPVCIAIGVLEASTQSSGVIRVGRRLATVSLSVFFLLFGWGAYEYIALEEDFRVARFEALRFGTTPQDYVRPKVHLLTQLEALAWATRFSPTVNVSKHDLDLLRRVALHFPWTATQNRYALTLALNGNPTEAIRQLAVMRSMHGKRTHELLMENWLELSNTKFPQLKGQGIFPPSNGDN